MSSIAIVGRSCLLPEAFHIDSFWNILSSGQDILTSVSPGEVNITETAMKEAAADQNDIPHLAGGYVKGFEQVFDPGGFKLTRSQMAGTNELNQWVSYTAKACLQDAGLVDPVRSGQLKTALVLGNLSLPTPEFSQFCESVWNGDCPSGSGRFMSGGPALFAAEALGLTGPAFSLDAACASSLYGISRACDLLLRGEARLVLAGAVNRADQLFLHGGFHQLQALSLKGVSKPLQSDGDGLLPSEGAAFIGMMRYEDAIELGCPVLGLISGVGLSNDGKSKGFLVPSPEGQVMAMKRAYDQAGVRPEEIRYLECHATGTPTGDSAELQAIQQVFEGNPLRAGSLKGHMGHLITVSGMVAVLKVLEVFKRKQIPPTLHWKNPLREVSEANLEISGEFQPWNPEDRFAAVSAFGFGGNNAHLILESPPDTQLKTDALKVRSRQFPSGLDARISLPKKRDAMSCKVALIGLEMRVGGAKNLATYLRARESEKGIKSTLIHGPLQGSIDLDLTKIASPPNDLSAALPQQLLIAEVALNLFDQNISIDPEATGVFVGMETHPDVARYGKRWRKIDKSICGPLSAQGVIGTLPNIVANRLNRMLQITGSGVTISSENYSGLDALSWGINDIETGRLESAVIGAVDFSCNPVHVQSLLNRTGENPGVSDGAVVMVLKSLDAAQKNQDKILGVFESDSETYRMEKDQNHVPVTEIRSGAFAASGLIELVAKLFESSDDGRKKLIRLSQPGFSGRVWSQNFTSLSGPSTNDRNEILTRNKKMSFPERWPDISVSGESLSAKGQHVNHSKRPKKIETYQMTPAPWLPSVDSEEWKKHSLTETGEIQDRSLIRNAVKEGENPTEKGSQERNKSTFPSDSVRQYYAQVSRSHQNYLSYQSDAYQSFVASHSTKLETLLDLFKKDQTLLFENQKSNDKRSIPNSIDHSLDREIYRKIQPDESEKKSPAVDKITSDTFNVGDLNRGAGEEKVLAPGLSANINQLSTAIPASSLPTTLPPEPVVKENSLGAAADLIVEKYEELSLNREQLILHSQGAISRIFGSRFRDLDSFKRVVRMPQPPLLLADRVVSMKGVSRSLGTGSVITETDVRSGEVYEFRGHFLPGLLVEAGQADLLLISWLGIDFLNRGEKVYRLLGCELCYHGDMPAVGDSLRYEIHLDRHIEHNDTRLFFFHSDCFDVETGRKVLTVRNGQAGFFTDEELSKPGGIIWDAEKELADDKQRPLVRHQLSSGEQIFAEDQIQLFSEGKIWECFGRGYERGASHHQSPGIPAGKMLLFDRVTRCDTKGGPLNRGYLRAEFDISPDQWFFEGHFKDDPCMPGTMMLDGCFQVMAFYMTLIGQTLSRDGWRFKPVSDVSYKLKCRGQVTPASKKLSYEIFIRESEDTDRVFLIADVMCQVDGLNAFHAQELSLELIPDWPLVEKPLLDEETQVEGLSFPLSIRASSLGKPSEAFGPNYLNFDHGMRVARLPAPPLCCVSRILSFEGEEFKLVPGAELKTEFSFEATDWFCKPSGWAELPFGILLEVALQGCGVLASVVGSALRSDQELFFRNLDGKGKIFKPVFAEAGPVTTTVSLTKVSGIAEILIEGFKIVCRQNQNIVAEFESEFGFFPAAALEKQAGLPPLPDRERYLDLEQNIQPELQEDKHPKASCTLPPEPLSMSGHVTGYWPDGGRNALGIIRAEKVIEPSDWYFKAHFFQDPVQPGSLGLEGMVQLMQWYALEKGLPEAMVSPRWSLANESQEISWKYRGQIRPENKLVKTIVEILHAEHSENCVQIHAKGSLWCDGARIYEASSLNLTIVDSDPDGAKELIPGSDREDEIQHQDSESGLKSPEDSSLEKAGIDATSNEKVIFFDTDQTQGPINSYSGIGWAKNLLSLPEVLGKTLMKVRAAEYPWSLQGTGLRNFFLHSGLDRDQVKACKVMISGVNVPGESHARKVSLRQGETTIGEGVFFRGGKKAGGAALPEPKGEWSSGSEFLHKCELSENIPGLISYRHSQNELNLKIQSGSEADDHNRFMQMFRLCLLSQPVLNSELFYQGLDKSITLTPYKIHAMDIFQVIPQQSELECVSRLVGSLGSQNEPVFLMQLVYSQENGQRVVLVEWQLVCHIFPKTQVDLWDIDKRSKFIGGGFVQGVGLSRRYDTETRLGSSAIEALNQIEGSVSAVWGSSDPVKILRKEHQGYGEKMHPKLLPDGLPLTTFSDQITHENDELMIRSPYKPRIDVGRVVSYWNQRFGEEHWIIGDLLEGLLSKFVRRLLYTHSDLNRSLPKRGVLYIANHQVGIESFLFSAIQSAMTEVPVHVIAKSEHQSSWLGGLIQDIFSVPGCSIASPMVFFDRHKPSELPGLLSQQGNFIQSGERSLLIHVEGTRGLSGKDRVKKLSQVLPEFQQSLQCDMIPVQFSGGLPDRPLEKRLEFPFAMGKQDFRLGEPVLPGVLQHLNLTERKEFLSSRINDPHPGVGELPFEKDEVFARKVHSWMLESGAALENAVLFCILQEMWENSAPLSEETISILEARNGLPIAGLADPERALWLKRFAKKLLGRKYKD